MKKKRKLIEAKTEKKLFGIIGDLCKEIAMVSHKNCGNNTNQLILNINTTTLQVIEHICRITNSSLQASVKEMEKR